MFLPSFEGRGRFLAKLQQRWHSRPLSVALLCGDSNIAARRSLFFLCPNGKDFLVDGKVIAPKIGRQNRLLRKIYSACLSGVASL